MQGPTDQPTLVGPAVDVYGGLNGPPRDPENVAGGPPPSESHRRNSPAKQWCLFEEPRVILVVSGWGGGQGGKGVFHSQVLFRRGGRGVRGGRGERGGPSNVVLSARVFVGITSCSVGNCTVTSCLVVASNIFSQSSLP